jgi:hypothetical protein
MIINYKENSITPDPKCYFVRDIDKKIIFTKVYLGLFEIDGKVYNLTKDNFSEYKY